jgi:hypothetical protein
MTKTALSECTPFGLSVPAKLSLGRAGSEVEMADSAKFRGVITWGGTFSRVICMINVYFLNVPAISNSDVNRATGIQCVVEYSVHPFIGMYL